MFFRNTHVCVSGVTFLSFATHTKGTLIHLSRCIYVNILTLKLVFDESNKNITQDFSLDDRISRSAKRQLEKRNWQYLPYNHQNYKLKVLRHSEVISIFYRRTLNVVCYYLVFTLTDWVTGTQCSRLSLFWTCLGAQKVGGFPRQTRVRTRRKTKGETSQGHSSQRHN